MDRKFDFSGWATKNDLLCADGRVIRHNAFQDNDGQTVPLVYQHQHSDPMNILGHALLENRKDGVYAYCSFNDTPTAQHVKTAVQHGDVVSLSIYANKLVQKGKDVLHGVIREVSIVLAGANPGAYIDNPVLVHGEGTENESYEDDLTEAIIYANSEISLYHSDLPGDADQEDVKKDDGKKESEDKDMADKPTGKTVQEVIDTMSPEQKQAMYYVVGAALEDQGVDDDENDNEEDEDEDMKHNVFENDTKTGSYLSHSDEMTIISNAKKLGTLQQAISAFAEENSLSHDDLVPASGFDSYGGGVDALFPEWHDVRPGAPELVTDDLNWVDMVLNKVHRSPFSRIRTSQVDIRGIEALRAKGYEKGNRKDVNGQYAVVKRTHDPQTVFVKSALNRDDVVDITDFDYVGYQYEIDRKQLLEELATAILISDQRPDDAEYKIEETHIRSIWNDDDLFTIKVDLSEYLDNINGEFSENFGDNYRYSEALVAAMLDAMIDYRGSGSLDMFCTQQFINRMLLARDLNGRRIYANKGELATALGVNRIIPVSKFANKFRTKGTGANAKTMKLDAIVVDLTDYSLGSTKGGQITKFDQFDIDFNQLKSLIETRLSGANTRIYSAIVIEEDVTANPLTGLKVDLAFPETVDTDDLFGKAITDLQTNVKVGATGIDGILKYVADYSAAGYTGDEAHGHFLVLHADVPGVTGVTYTAEVLGGEHGEQTMDEDQTVISYIKDTTKRIRITATKGNNTFSKTFRLNGLKLLRG